MNSERTTDNVIDMSPWLDEKRREELEEDEYQRQRREREMWENLKMMALTAIFAVLSGLMAGFVGASLFHLVKR